MNKFKISNLSFCFIYLVLLNSTLLGMLFPYVLYEANTSVFISLLISYVIGLIPLFIYFKIFNFLPDKNIFEKIEYAFPKIISKILIFIIFILFLGIGVIIFWRLTTFISSEFLIETPSLFISIILATPILYLVLYDYDVIARLSFFCILLGFGLLIFNVIALSSQFDLQNLKPLLNNDFMHLSKSSVTYSIIFIMTSFMTLAIPKNNILKNEKTNKYIFISYTISYLFIAMIFFSIISVLGINISKLYTFPSYAVLKTINIFSFVQNLENINILIWVLFMTFTSAFCLLFLKSAMSSIFKFTKKRINIITSIVLFIIFFILTLLLIPFESVINKYKYVYVPLLIYFVILVLLLIVYIAGKVKFRFKNG